MAWERTEWACGHSGHIQLYGKNSARESRVASEASRKCMACWLVEQWEKEEDPRAKREDRYKLAAQIAKGKDKIIDDVDPCVPVKNGKGALKAERDKLVARIAEIDAILNS